MLSSRPFVYSFFFFFLMIRRPPRSTLFPYTTLSDLMIRRPRRHLSPGVLLQRSDHGQDRKSTRLNSSHLRISYAVFCLKKKKTHKNTRQRPASHSACYEETSRVDCRCPCCCFSRISPLCYSSLLLFSFFFFFLKKRAPPKFTPFPPPALFRF